MRRERAEACAEVIESLMPGLVRAALNQESRRLGRHSLTLPQFFTLSALEEGPRMMKELGSVLGLSMGTVTGIVDRLARAGLVERRGDERDRRVVLAALTPRGEELMATIRRERVTAFSRRLQEMDEREVERFIDLLTRYGTRLAAGDGEGGFEDEEGTDVL